MAARPKTTLTGNEATDAFDLTSIASDASYTVRGAVSGTITPQYSNIPGEKVDADWDSAPDTITSFPSGPWQLPFGIAKYVRFKGTTVVGTAAFSWGPAFDGKGNPVSIGTEHVHQSQVTS